MTATRDPSPHVVGRALTAFYGITAAVGGGSVLAFWLWRGRPDAAIFRAVFLCASLALVHVVGYYAYTAQTLPGAVRPKLARAVRERLQFNLVVQTLLLFFSECILDGGVCYRTVALASAGYWIGLALVAIRRPAAPTRDDLDFVRVGFFALLPLALALQYSVPRLAAYS